MECKIIRKSVTKKGRVILKLVHLWSAELSQRYCHSMPTENFVSIALMKRKKIFLS